MAGDRDIRETVLSGDQYARARLSTRQLFPLSLEWRVRACILTLGLTVLVAPTTYARRGLIGSLEGELVASGALEPAFALIALAGALVTFAVGLVMIGLLYVVETKPMSLEEAKRLLWLEDAVMVIAISPGISFVLIAVSLSLLGFIAPGIVSSLYAQGVAIYATGSGLAAVDVWYTSVVGGGLAIVLTSCQWQVQGTVAARAT